MATSTLHGGPTASAGGIPLPADRGLHRPRGRAPSTTTRQYSIPTASRRYYLYLMLPAIVVLAAISLYPFFWLVYMSFHNVELGAGSDTFIGLKNFERLLRDDKFLDGWVLLLKYSALCMSSRWCWASCWR